MSLLNYMNASMHIHRLAPSWWLGNILFGGRLFFIAISSIILSMLNPSSISSLIFSVVMFGVIFPFSLVLIARPFTTKIIVKPEGIEYHSTFFILQANWRDLVNLGYINNTNAGKTLVIIPKKGSLIFRKWSKPFQYLFKEYPHNLQDVKILVSLFNVSDGHSFESDVLMNVKRNVEEFSENWSAKS